MSKPTEEELEEALAEAARMRETDDDPHHVAKALLNLNYRFEYLDKVLYAAERYIRSGHAEFEHAHLLRAIANYKKADALSMPAEETEDFGLQ